jgi:hypothetical protein
MPAERTDGSIFLSSVRTRVREPDRAGTRPDPYSDVHNLTGYYDQPAAVVPSALSALSALSFTDCSRRRSSPVAAVTSM